MATYTVKNGENLYDIALKLFGSVEGIFNLLVCNQDAISETGLSLDQTLECGTVLTYTNNKVINQSVVSEIVNKNISVKNGERMFNFLTPDSFIRSYIIKFNIEVIKKSLELWPDIIGYEQQLADEETIIDYLKYLNASCVWTETFSEEDIPDIIAGDYSKAFEITQEASFRVPKLVVKQNGMSSKITYNMNKQSIMLIDWGDNKDVEMCIQTNKRQELEHCYDDSGSHTIMIYGEFGFSMLDLSEINGVYYPLSKIVVTNNFYTALPNNNTINRLISST